MHGIHGASLMIFVGGPFFVRDGRVVLGGQEGQAGGIVKD
jgi:hypothetical protein